MRAELQAIKKKTVAMCALETQVLLGNVKPKKPRKPRAKGYKCDRAEDRLRMEIIKALRKEGCTVFRLEPSFRGVWGVSDLLVFSPYYNKGMLFMEVKTIKGYLSKDQRVFENLCINSCQKYIVVTSSQQAIDVVKG